MAAAGLYALKMGLDIFGGIKNAQAQKEQAEFEAKQQEFNAQVADLQGQDAIDRGDQQATNLEKQSNQLKGSQVAAAAAQGLSVNAGDPAALVAETDKYSMMDILNIKNNAAREAFGYKAQAGMSRNQAGMTRKTGDAMAANTILTAGANAIGTAGSYATSKMKTAKYSKSDLMSILNGE